MFRSDSADGWSQSDVLGDNEAPDEPMAAQFRHRIAGLGLTVVGAAALGYFLYHGIHGDRGLMAYVRLNHDVALIKTQLAAVRGERQALERKVALLRPGRLDPDMLDERARVMLNLVAQDEIVILNADLDTDVANNEH